MLECSSCTELKPETSFWKQKTKRGYFRECKACFGSRNKRWIEENRLQFREANLKASHKYRKSNKLKMLVEYARRRAMASGIDFDLSYDSLNVPEECPVLGIPLFSGFGEGKSSSGRYNSPSLDRIDPKKGYTNDNVIIISWRANRIKSDATLEELTKIARFYEGLASQKGGQATLP